jgi:mannose-1-phosphate guanylyltransferase
MSMKILIVAGGSGKRFWPISRFKYPKIFIPLIDNKSTFQLQIERAKKIVSIEDIYVATNEKYVSIVKAQTPELSTSNIIGEPMKKDLLAALGLALIKLKKLGITEPVTYLASDHIIKRFDEFKRSLQVSEELVKKNNNRVVFFGEKPLYPTNNLGWIHIGKMLEKRKGIPINEYKSWIYRPEINKCKKMFKTHQWLWNVNYITFTISFVLDQYKLLFPDTYKKLLIIMKSLETRNESRVTKEIYPTLEEAHSDALWQRLKPRQAVVLNLNLGWSDPGTLYALKKTLEKNENENITKGNIFNYKSRDCFVYNDDGDKLVTTINLDGMVIVNTKDALLVVDKDHVRFIGDMLEKFKDTDFEKYL